MRTFIIVLIVGGAVASLFWYPPVREWFFATFQKQVTQGVDVQRLANDQYERTLLTAAETLPCPNDMPDCLSRELLEATATETRRLNNGIDVPVEQAGHVFTMNYRSVVETGVQGFTGVYASANGEPISLSECIVSANGNPRTAILHLRQGSAPVGGSASGTELERRVIFSGGDDVACQVNGSVTDWHE